MRVFGTKSKTELFGCFLSVSSEFLEFICVFKNTGGGEHGVEDIPAHSNLVCAALAALAS